MTAANQRTENFRGVWTAIATPFTDSPEPKAIDWPAFDRLVEHQCQAKVTGIVVCGTTGEAPALNDDERIALVARARKNSPPSVRVMAGTGTNNTVQSVELSRRAKEAGADSLLIVTPPYNKPSPAGLMQHFQMIASASKLPICLYHVPGRTNQKLTLATIQQICSIPEVTSIKEASADLTLFSECVQEIPGRTILSGDDFTFLPTLSIGGGGVVSVISNIFPGEMVRLYNAFSEKNIELAKKLHHALFPTMNMLFCETNPGPLKAALEIRKLANNALRAPLAPVTESSYKNIQRSIDRTLALLVEVR